MVILFPMQEGPRGWFFATDHVFFSWLFPWGAAGFHAITPGWCSQEAGAPGPLFIQSVNKVSFLCQSRAQCAEGNGLD